MTRATPSSAGGWLGIVHRVRREVQSTRKKNEYAEKKDAARISCHEKRVWVGWGGSEVAAPIVTPSPKTQPVIYQAVLKLLM